MNKKASANMWWVIIGAVIAMVVMIVLLGIFTGGTSKSNKSLFDCTSKGGKCVGVGSCKNPDGTSGSVVSAFTCDTKGEQCCFGS